MGTTFYLNRVSRTKYEFRGKTTANTPQDDGLIIRIGFYNILIFASFILSLQHTLAFTKKNGILNTRQIFFILITLFSSKKKKITWDASSKERFQEWVGRQESSH